MRKNPAFAKFTHDIYVAGTLPSPLVPISLTKGVLYCIAFVLHGYSDPIGKVVAAICHAPWMLCSAKILTGRKATAYFSIRDDVEHAGAIWQDGEAIVDSDPTHGGTRPNIQPFVILQHI